MVDGMKKGLWSGDGEDFKDQRILCSLAIVSD